jgi:C1A family cysteine protease
MSVDPKKYGLGWKRGLPDFRDKKYRAPRRTSPLPETIDLRKELGGFANFRVWDQGELGSCTAQGVGACLVYNMFQQKQKAWVPSRLFIYYNSRVLEGTVNEDAGAEIKDVIKTVSTTGAAHEEIWRYDINKFRQRPPQSVYADALKFKAVTYAALNNANLDQLKACLAAGELFTFGSTLYNSFFDSVRNGGYVPMPNWRDGIVGGHCMTAVGYTKTHFIIRNSWGESAGDKGYMYMPHKYLTDTNLTADVWQIKTVTEDPKPDPGQGKGKKSK